MAKGRAGRAGRLVEVDDALVDGGQHRERGNELRDRGPAEAVVVGPVAREDAIGPDDGRGGVGRAPRVDRGEDVARQAASAERRRLIDSGARLGDLSGANALVMRSLEAESGNEHSK